MIRPIAAVRTLAASLVVAVLCSATSAQAELRALLVGVSGYPTLPERYRLEGPRNDVQRMSQVLLQRGFAADRIETLADGVPGAALPTRANILGALARLAGVAQPGDTVFVHFAGHGSQQPADRSSVAGRDESDGLHETFLPLDIGVWDGPAQTVANAIVNFELRAAIDRITDRGAFVWGVFDACHSATLVRGAVNGTLRYRLVEPKDLGIPRSRLDRAARAAPTRGGAVAKPGALGSSGGATAFFYATQTTELTPELALPADAADRRAYGLFSFTVAKALERAQPISYRQLGQYVLSEYGSIVEARATPLFAGNGLDTLVLGQTRAPLRQWPLQVGETISVPVGSLSGIEVGAVLAIVPGPLATSDEAIGYVEAKATQADRADLVPIAHARRPAPSRVELRAGQYVRLVFSPPQFALRVALDRHGCAPDCALGSAVELLRRQGTTGVEAVWVDAAAGADIVVQQVGERAVFLPPTEQADDLASRARALGLPLHDPAARNESAAQLAARVAANLHLIARARNLLRIAATLGAESPANGLRTALTRRAGKSGTAQPITVESVPDLHDGDQLSLTVRNTGLVALDLTVLYLNADYGVTALFPNRLGESNRLEAGATRTIDEIEIHASPEGLERLMLIAVAAQRLGERADFSYLEQPALTRRRSMASHEFDVFADAAFADFRQRGAGRPAAPSRSTSMQVFTVKVGR